MFPEERSLVEDMQGRPFVLLGVNAGDELETAQKSVKKNNLNWRSFFDGDSGRITGLFKVRAFPTVMLIDHKGKIAFPNLRGPKLIPEINKLVKAAERDGMEGDKNEPEMRTFKDRTGKHRVKAVAEAMSDGKVRLRKQDGETVIMSLVDLSRSDQDYLRTVDVPAMDEDSAKPEEAGFRTYVDATGDHEVEAEFVKLEDGKVTLRKRDGKTTRLPLDRLSEDDQKYVKKRAKGS